MPLVCASLVIIGQKFSEEVTFELWPEDGERSACRGSGQRGPCVTILPRRTRQGLGIY